MKKILVLLFTVFVIENASIGYAKQHNKDNWYIGFGLGYGDVQVKPDGSDSFSFSDVDGSTQFSLQFGIGGMVSEKFHLGFDLSVISYSNTITYTWNTVEQTMQFKNYLLMATFFPNKKGFFLRAGAGLSSWSITIENKMLSGSEIFSGSESVSGIGVLGGIGYAFWIGESFNLVLNFDVGLASFSDKDNFEGKLTYYNMYLSFYWF